MKNKRVMLIKSGRFIGGVISSLFKSNEKLTVIETQPQDGTALINEVKKHHPDVVVLDDTLKFEYLNDLLPFLSRSEGFRIIIVNTSSNQIEVYQRNSMPVRQSADLFAVI